MRVPGQNLLQLHFNWARCLVNIDSFLKQEYKIRRHALWTAKQFKSVPFQERTLFFLEAS